MKKISKISIISITLYVILNFLWDSMLADKIASLPSPIAEFINNYIAPASILAFFFTCVFWFLWKVPVVRNLTQWLFDTNTCITGLWIGKMHFQWEGKNQTKIIFLSVKQSNAYSVTCILYTESRTSFSETAFIDKEKGIERLIYTYDAEKAVKSPETNPQHSGITILTIGKNKKILSGEYFTNQKTAGRIELDFLSGKNASSFKDAAIIFKKCSRKREHLTFLLSYMSCI